MEEKLKNTALQGLFEKIILIFIGCQVLIDLLTAFSLKILNSTFSVGMVTRFVFVGFIIVYIVLFGNRLTKALTALLLIMFAGHLAYAVLSLGGSLFTNVRYYLRLSVFPLSVLLFGNMFYNKDNDENRAELLNKIFVILNSLIFSIGIVYILSVISGVSIPMYEDGRIGTSAWFLSGNEMASSMIILSGIPIYCYCKKQSWFNLINIFMQFFIIIMIGTKSSIIILVTTAALIIYCIAGLVIRKKCIVSHVIIMLCALIALGVFYNHIPAVKNIIIQKEIADRVKLFSSQREGEQVPDKIVQIHSNAVPEDDGTYMATVLVKAVDNRLDVSGYFYPCYFDLSHPNYISKKLVFVDAEGNREELELADTYNPYIDNPKSDVYKSYFAGISGSFDDVLEIGKEYKVYMDITADEISRTYEMNSGLNLDFDKSNKKANLNGSTVTFAENPGYVPPDTTQKPEKNIQYNKPGSYSMWFSGRNTRIDTLINKYLKTNIVNDLFGYGYVSNYEGMNYTGLEMDFIEIFITLGIIGGIIYFCGYFYLLFGGLVYGIKAGGIKLLVKTETLTLLLPLLLSAASAFMAGHTFLMPSVSIKVAVVAALFYYSCKLSCQSRNTESCKEPAGEDNNDTEVKYPDA